MKAAFYTLGCKVNQHDTRVMMDTLLSHGYEIVPFDNIADVYVINSCTVTGQGGKKSRNACMRARRTNPGAIVCLTGCLAQAEEIPAGLADVVMGVADRSKLYECVRSAISGKRVEAVSDINAVTAFETVSPTSFERTRAHLKIQEGCDNFCAYCIVPFVRGRSRGRDIASIRDTALSLVRDGYNEVVLTGINLSAYGADTGSSLAEVIQTVCETGVKRLRLSSLEPHIITKDFVQTVTRSEAVCPHFHISLQSGCDATLTRMGRRYSTGDYRKRVDMLRAAMPEAGITTDIIAGFPGETPEDFETTMSFARDIGFSRVHVFPYSRRKGTRAYDMPGQIPRAEKERRARALISLAGDMEADFIKAFTGKELPVLIERSDSENSFGYTHNYIWTRIDGPLHAGNIVSVRIYDAFDNTAIAKITE